jgi:hypothetical protein
LVLFVFVVMPSLSPEELALVHKAIPNCETKCVAVAKLYVGQNNQWEYTGLVGALACCIDAAKKSYFLKFVDLKKTVPVWEQEFYEGFVYSAPKPFFHTLESDSVVYGLNFADETEAKNFFAQVLHCKNTPFMTPEQKAQLKSSMIRKKEQNKKEAKKDKDIKKIKHFFAKIFGKDESSAIELSAPTNFRHQGHIGWDPEKGFEVSNIPPEWKSVFVSAGIKKSELRNPETAKYVMNIISDAVASDSVAEPTPSPHNVSTTANDSTSSSSSATSSTVPSASLTAPSLSSPPQSPSSAPPPPPPPPPPPQPSQASSPSESMNTTPSETTPAKKSSGLPTPPPQNSALLDQIRSGTQLRKVDLSRPMPDLSKLAPEKKKTLTETLASAMALRRAELEVDDTSTSADGDDSDEWSD